MDDKEISRRDLLKLLAALGVATTTDVLAQDTAKTDPRAPRVILENFRLRVLEYRSKAGLGYCGEGQHSHPDHLSIALTPAKVRITLADGNAVPVEKRMGDVSYSPAGPHVTQTLGGKDVRVYIVEFKAGDFKPFKAGT